MSSFQRNSFHGPSSSSNRTPKRKLTAKQTLLSKQLFGTDSECENENESTKQPEQKQFIESVGEKEKADDILEITVDNSIFDSVTSPIHQQSELITPNKLQQLTQLPPLISPIPKTPLAKQSEEQKSSCTPIHDKFITPSKLQQILVQPFKSPLAKTRQSAKQPVNERETHTPLFPTSPYSIHIQLPLEKINVSTKAIAPNVIDNTQNDIANAYLQTALVKQPNYNYEEYSSTQNWRFGESKQNSHAHRTFESPHHRIHARSTSIGIPSQQQYQANTHAQKITNIPSRTINLPQASASEEAHARSRSQISTHAHSQKPSENEHQLKVAHQSSSQLHAATSASSIRFREPLHRSQQEQHISATRIRTNTQANAVANTSIVHNQAVEKVHAQSYTAPHAHAQTKFQKQLQQVRCNPCYGSKRYAPFEVPALLPPLIKPKTTFAVKKPTIATTTVQRSIDQNQSQAQFLNKNRQIRNTHSKGPIVEMHNFEREIRVEITNTQRQPIVEKEVANQASDGTRIIDLRNKNVPKGVHLAIAVDKNKRLSKNALKKITRNLANQM